jgi:hypothetical protein
MPELRILKMEWLCGFTRATEDREERGFLLGSTEDRD